MIFAISGGASIGAQKSNISWEMTRGVFGAVFCGHHSKHEQYDGNPAE